VVQHGQRRTDVPRPVAERRQPPAGVVGQVLQVEQHTATGVEPAQQPFRALLPLVGVPEEHVPVPQRGWIFRQLLQPDDHGVPRRVDPAALLGHGAARGGVVLDRVHALRGPFDGHGEALAHERGGVGRRDRRAAFGDPHLAAHPQFDGHVVQR
jgi:hypothetical protein